MKKDTGSARPSAMKILVNGYDFRRKYQKNGYIYYYCHEYKKGYVKQNFKLYTIKSQ